MIRLKPSFYGEVGPESSFIREGYIISGIEHLEVLDSTLPKDDIVSLAGICCLVSEKAKQALIESGLTENDFGEALIKTGELVYRNSYYFIKLTIQHEEINVYHNSYLIVSNTVYNNLKKLNISNCIAVKNIGSNLN